MARYRKIDPRIWNDEKFRTLSHEAQRLFLFVLTHPSMTSLGAFRISRAGMAEELGLSESLTGSLSKAFQEAFLEVLNKGMLKYDEKAFLVFAPRFLKYNAPESPNVIKGWFKAADLLPECPLKLEVIKVAGQCISSMGDPFKKAFSETFEKALESLSDTLSEALPKAFRKSMPNQEQEQEYISCIGADVDNSVDNPESKPLGRNVQLSMLFMENGIKSQPAHPYIIALANQDVSLDTVKAAIATAKKSNSNPSLKYVIGILKHWKEDARRIDVRGAAPPKKGQDAWWKDENSVLAKGKELGLSPHSGEGWEPFKARIRQAIEQRERTKQG